MDIFALQSIFNAIWIRETSAFPDRWTPQNPALGQCLATSVIARDQLGGSVSMLSGPAGSGFVHFRNTLRYGAKHDFTAAQLSCFDIDPSTLKEREFDQAEFEMWRHVFPEIDRRYRLLRHCFFKHLRAAA